VTAAVRDAAQPGYGLGPWASSPDRPERVTMRPIADAGAGSRLYAPAERMPRGAFLISPGLHFEGPCDPRMDRLARIFANAGFVVLVPAVRDLMSLRITANVTYDVAAALTALLDAPELPVGCRPAIFSVSVGSLAGLRVAAMYRSMISHLVVFGGYVDPIALIRALTAPDARDPLNAPAAMITLLDRMPNAPTGDDAVTLRDAWRAMIRATWPRRELKVAGSTLHHPIARAIASDLPRHLQRMFLVGCGVLPGAWSLCEAGFAAPGRPFDYLDPRADLHRIECPVTIVHGITDDVIPFAQAGELERALPAGVARPTLATGMLAHSSTVGISKLGGLARELVTFNRICRAIDRPAPDLSRSLRVSLGGPR
jgi:pimeloyl-ACP methyl ester carboxylesterase